MTTLHRESDDVLSVEASTLGLRPGVWPPFLRVGKNNAAFAYSHEIEHEGELLYVEYINGNERLRVFND